MLAGLIAAIMSSIDSTLNSASTLVTLDFIQPRHPEMSPRRVALVGRITIGVFMVLAALWAPQIAHFRGLFGYLQQLLSYIVPPVVPLFIVGLFWRRGTAGAGLWTMIGGHALSVAVFVGQKIGVLPPLHFTIVAGLLFFVCCVLFIVISLVGNAPEQGAVPAAPVADSPGGVSWWADYRLQSLLLLTLTAAMVVAFW